MSRFASSPDAAFRALNDSISFDIRLAPYDVAQSRAHATMLAARGIISDPERDDLLEGLGRVEAELSDGSFEVAPADQDIHMPIDRRLTHTPARVGANLHTPPS